MATMNTAIPGSPYRVPPEPSRTSSMVLAAAVHAGLLLFLWIGVSWQNTEPVEVTAEVWDMKVQSAAAPPEPAPPPPPQPKPEPVEPVKPPPPPPKVVEQPVAPKPPDISLEREKKQKELKLKQLQEQKLQEEKLREKKLVDEKRELEKARKDLAEQKKRDQEEADAKKAEKAEQLAKEKAEKAAKAKLAAAEEAKLKASRDAEMKRITGAAGAGGEVQKATAPRNDASYIASITAVIKPKIRVPPGDEVGNAIAVFRIEQLPTGEIMSTKMIKSSGVPAFDNAVEKGIIAAEKLPKRKDGTVERSLEIGFKGKDLN